MLVRRSGAVAGAMAALLTACGAAPAGHRALPPPGSATTPGGAATTATTAGETTKAAPRWETVATFSGTGPSDGPGATIAAGAIQWRVRWSCGTGTLRVTSTPAPKRPGPLVDAGCPGQGDAFSIRTGPTRIGVETPGPWALTVEQQVDDPIDEPAPADLGSATLVAQGSFFPVERKGRGRALLYRYPDGRRILRFEDFEVSQNTDLFVWLSESPKPETSAQAVAAGKVVLADLKSTLGNQNYPVPADVPAGHIRSVVIWCKPVAVAYLAAALGG
ncbi:MAG: DM13 domain-containing protein [Actinobacteria bacterium]|nr:DM13 domain-containing protein [Actinomycetota bacterium]